MKLKALGILGFFVFLLIGSSIALALPYADSIYDDYGVDREYNLLRRASWAIFNPVAPSSSGDCPTGSYYSSYYQACYIGSGLFKSWAWGAFNGTASIERFRVSARDINRTSNQSFVYHLWARTLLSNGSIGWEYLGQGGVRNGRANQITSFDYSGSVSGYLIGLNASMSSPIGINWVKAYTSSMPLADISTWFAELKESIRAWFESLFN